MTDANRTTRWFTALRRFVVVALVSAAGLLLMAWILPGISVSGWRAVVGAVVVLAVLNGIVWPLVARFAAPLILWTAGLLGLVANGLILALAAEVIDGFHVDSLLDAVMASLGMTAVSAIAGSVLAIDDDVVWRRTVIRRMVRRLEPPEPTDVAGVLFLQIDGLSEPVLRRALGEGYLPTLARWVRSGTHRITGWQCDLSSQTGAMQAGILHGDNSNMPAFRWYDKASGKVLTSNRPADAAEIERRQSDGNGLLADGGVSRSNVFSGDSQDSMFTFSTITDRERASKHGFAYFVSDPNAVARIIVLSLADIGRELSAAWRARRRDVEPRGHRGGIYPLLRAATTVILRDLTIYTLLADVYRGVPSAYADFVGYDEVAHHSGISAPDALETLWRLDQQLARLERAIHEAPRPYHVVILSDHGQTQGATFLQRYGHTLGEFTESLLDGGQVDQPAFSTEGWGNLNGVLSDAISDENSRLGRTLARIVKPRTIDGEVVLGPGYRAAAEHEEPHDVIVLASGNLGLVSFPHMDGRVTVEQLAERYPAFVQRLAEHPGVGFIMVRSAGAGTMVVGGHGIRYLEDDTVAGLDPLAPFPATTADHLRRTDSFTNCPDLLVNSFYDPDIDEGAAFEELIGFHGGLGGKQAEPFVLHPASFAVPDEPLVGAEAIHHLFQGWLAAVDGPDAPTPWQPPPESADVPVLPGAGPAR